MHVLGLCFARQFSYAVATKQGVAESHVADFLSLDPVTAAATFVDWWKRQGPEATAVMWPSQPPHRYVGLLKFIADQENVFSVPPRMIKDQCGGRDCTVADVIRTAKLRHHTANPETYEQAVACLAAGLCAGRVLHRSDEGPAVGD